jgi:hypothetical protein
MLLFPYAKDLEYIDGELGFVLQFVGKTKTTDVSIKMGLDKDLSETIEKLLEERDDLV